MFTMNPNRNPGAPLGAGLLLAVAGFLPGGSVASAADAKASSEELFAHRIQPLFKDKCLACHGDDEKKIKGGLDMRTMAGLLKGGESEKPSVVPGKPMESPLYLAATREHEDENWSAMPPKENDALSKEQIAYIKDWIVGGASWPDEKRIAELLKSGGDKWSAKGGVVLDVGGLSPEWAGRGYKPEDLWAYQPVKKPAVPEIANHKSQIANPIDAFLAAKWPQGAKPSPLADRTTLIRRVTFDLTGLPPTPEEIAAFVADKDSDEKAFAKVVERLLASPHYGEKWGQHWLDVVRYADSSGFANDYVRGNAWRYRDYVSVRSTRTSRMTSLCASRSRATNWIRRIPRCSWRSASSAWGHGSLPAWRWRRSRASVSSMTRRTWWGRRSWRTCSSARAATTTSSIRSRPGISIRCRRCSRRRSSPSATRRCSTARTSPDSRSASISRHGGRNT
ncbi:MAG: DUF1549 domain-containing protein [Verrucomicrobiae bacterium]|nr:DUF1549 domain-containing protein [Verrucomicrobiae bacterium]